MRQSCACLLWAAARLLRPRLACSTGLSEANIGDAALVSLAPSLASVPRLHSLWLDGNRVGDVGASALASALAGGALSRLRRLSLERNEIGDAGLAALGTALQIGAPRHMIIQLLVGHNPGSTAPLVAAMRFVFRQRRTIVV